VIVEGAVVSHGPVPMRLRLVRFSLGMSGDNPNTTQTLEYTKDKYNVKIIK
jgi:hypothetical protein